ncbi:MAG: glycoside hydrolase family 3 C-terminal domain-containing protein [Elusimicrobiota bacterium]
MISLALLCAASLWAAGKVPIWSDEFSVDGLPDPQKWGYDVGGDGWGNKELQFYTRERLENARVEDGKLILEAKKEPWEGRSYTSARLISRGKGDWTYGRIEVRAKLPEGRGTWPAIWMLPTGPEQGLGEPEMGELDIMEHVGHDPGVIQASAHCGAYNWPAKTEKTATLKVPDAMSAFHIYAVERRPTRIDFLVDGKRVLSFPNEGKGRQVWPFDRPFHLLLNVAVGGIWGGENGVDDSIFPARMEVDYVRVYEFPDVPDRTEALLRAMTLEEKASLTAGLDEMAGRGVPRLGIRPLRMTDGPNGVRWGKTTAFPSGISLASSFDPELARRVGEALALETLGRGRNILLGPCIDINRHPFGGRDFEGFGEDPFLSGRMAVGWIEGLQSQGVGASVKHFAANNQETLRTTIDARVGERALRELYLPAFEAAVREAHAWTVMAAYNRLNGPYCSASRWLLRELLKKEWGFKGLVVSDWGATHEGPGALSAGLDLEMPGPGAFMGGGLAKTARRDELEDAVRRILRVSDALGALDRDARENEYLMNKAETQALARETAEAGSVLLKNEGDALPLENVRKLAVIGPSAAQARVGGGGSSEVSPPYAVSPLEGLRELLKGKVELVYAQGSLLGDELDPLPKAAFSEDLLGQAVEAAKKADAAVVFTGLSKEYESEGVDRKNFGLPKEQDELIAAVAAANPRTVVVLLAGSPVDVEPWIGKVKALLVAWFPGMEGGRALARLLTGQANPSGRLPVTFPKQLADVPSSADFPGDSREVRYREGLFVGYRHYDSRNVEPRFPFGHGLSYTKFEYSGLRLERKGPLAVARLTVKNAGTRPGAEVVQAYVRPLRPRLERPFQELKAFSKILLDPGESREIVLHLPKRAFQAWNDERHAWVVDGKGFEIRVGASSRDIRLSEKLRY